MNVPIVALVRCGQPDLRADLSPEVGPICMPISSQRMWGAVYTVWERTQVETGREDRKRPIQRTDFDFATTQEDRACTTSPPLSSTE